MLENYGELYIYITTPYENPTPRSWSPRHPHLTLLGATQLPHAPGALGLALGGLVAGRTRAGRSRAAAGLPHSWMVFLREIPMKI